MIDFGDRKDLLFFFIMGFLLVIAFVIISLILIWKPKKEEKTFKVGYYESVSMTDDDKVNEYVEKISQLVQNDKYDDLYELISEDYLKYSKLKKEDLKGKLEYLGINSQSLSVENYTKKKMTSYNNVFCATVRGNVANKSARIVIKEISPRQFKISLDDIIFFDDSQSSQTAENIEFKFLSKKYTLSIVDYSVSITNNNKYSIYLNNNASGDTFLLMYDASSLKNQISTNERGSTIEIKPNETLKYNLSYKINDIEISNIRGIVVKDVKFSNENVANMQFNLYD